MIRYMRQALVLIVAASGAAAFVNAVRPKPLPWVIDRQTSVNPGENPQLAAEASISLEALRRHLADMSATIVDARKPDEYNEAHLAGAINLPSTEKEQHLDLVYQRLPRNGLIIIYCGGGNCEASAEVFSFLVSSGFRKENLRIYHEGWDVLGRLNDIPIAHGME